MYTTRPNSNVRTELSTRYNMSYSVAEESPPKCCHISPHPDRNGALQEGSGMQHPNPERGELVVVRGNLAEVRQRLANINERSTAIRGALLKSCRRPLGTCLMVSSCLVFLSFILFMYITTKLGSPSRSMNQTSQLPHNMSAWSASSKPSF